LKGVAFRSIGEVVDRHMLVAHLQLEPEDSEQPPTGGVGTTQVAGLPGCPLPLSSAGRGPSPRLRGSPDGGQYGLFTFDNAKDFPEPSLIKSLIKEIEKEVDGLRLGELWTYIHRNQNAGLDTKSYLVKFHSRFSLSFIPIVMCIIGIPFSVRGRREGGLAKDLGICLAITFFYWLFYSIGLSLGSNGAVPPLVAAWGSTLIFMALALVLVARQEK
jgi:lipopolysaccharide export LptBFGC system permease protein LptF